MKEEIQRVNQKINNIESLMTNFLVEISKNNLQTKEELPPQLEVGVNGDKTIIRK